MMKAFAVLQDGQVLGNRSEQKRSINWLKNNRALKGAVIEGVLVYYWICYKEVLWDDTSIRQAPQSISLLGYQRGLNWC